MKHTKTILFISIILLWFASSCKQRKDVIEYRQEIVINKTVDIYKGQTRYNIAYKSGGSEAYSFGLYSYFKIGDTIKMQRVNKGSWIVILAN